MQKLKNQVVDKMMRSHMTKAEVDFMLELSHFQDDKGKILGVYYKNVCTAIDISYETFYVTLDSLVNKGLLRKEKACYGDYDIVILNNDCSYPGAHQEGYVNTGIDLFYNQDFKKLKAGEKLLAMQFLKIAGAGERYYIGIKIFYEKYAELLNLTKRTLQTYLSRLKNFFKIMIKDRNYLIRLKEICHKYNAPSDMENFSEHLTKVACRRNRATYTTQEYKDTRRLISQCSPGKTITYIANAFLYAVRTSIERSNEQQSNKYKWNRQLNPKFIHKLLDSMR